MSGQDDDSERWSVTITRFDPAANKQKLRVLKTKVLNYSLFRPLFLGYTTQYRCPNLSCLPTQIKSVSIQTRVVTIETVSLGTELVKCGTGDTGDFTSTYRRWIISSRRQSASNSLLKSRFLPFACSILYFPDMNFVSNLQLTKEHRFLFRIRITRMQW